MRSKNRIYIVFFGLILACVSGINAQQADSLQAAPPPPSDEIIQLDVSEIQIKVETPQVTLFSDRIEPIFDEVHLEKSFIREITGEGERFEFDNTNSEQLIKQIDIDKMLNKMR